MNLTLMLVLMTMLISFLNSLPNAGLTMMDLWMFFCLLIPGVTVIIQVRVEFVRLSVLIQLYIEITHLDFFRKETTFMKKKIGIQNDIGDILTSTVVEDALRFYVLPGITFIFCILFFVFGFLFYFEY